MLEDLSDVAHDALPVRSLNLAHLVDILKAKRSQSSEFAVRKSKVTKVVLIPTLSAAEKAKPKFRFLSCGVSSS